MKQLFVNLDPDATKPDDWDESEPRTIIDESAEMPDGWLEDEPETVPDSEAEKPEDWDDELDGEWEPRQIENPLCKDAPGECKKKPHNLFDLRRCCPWRTRARFSTTLSLLYMWEEVQRCDC